jgi:endogenous inhibitor of DNA gyrase (YacG/DUF329 family)
MSEPTAVCPAYTPPATHVACPACGAPVEGIHGTYPPAVYIASFHLHCPRCGASWGELRSQPLGPEQTEPRWYNRAGNHLSPREEARRRRRAARLRREVSA